MLKPLDYNPVHPPSIYSWERTEGIMDLIERARKCVVFIGLVNDGDIFIPYGTGFLISLFHNEIEFSYVITCHHIINMFSENDVWIRINLNTGDSKSIKVPKNEWINDEINDISILPKMFGKATYDITRITEKDFATKESDVYDSFYAGEMIYLVGLFTSHYGSVHNIPIVRMGNIATMLDEPIYTGTEYVEAYLIELRSIGGLSGSPVFLYHRLSDLFLDSGSSVESYFLGMMRGRFNATDSGDVVAGDSIADTMNTGIGIVIPVDIILDRLNQPSLKTQREDTVKELRKKIHYRPTAATPKSINPQHKEDFTSLLSAAAKKKPQDDKT